MNDMTAKLRLVRLLKALLIGLAAGTLALSLYLAPTMLRQRTEAAANAIRQENLLPANGSAFDTFALAEARLTVLLDGQPHEGMAVAADRGFFSVPADGRLSLPLAPANYTLIAGYENRRLVYTCEIAAGQPNEIVLEINKAPQAAELRIWNTPAAEDFTVALEIMGADKISVRDFPEGVSIEKRQGKFSLCVRAGSLSPGFWCFRLLAENQYGDATMFACLRVERQVNPTPIYTMAELDAMRNNLAGHYVLMNDMDMSNVDDWLPIGTENKPFIGVFDGGGYEISGFHAPAEITETEQFGLFGHTKNAELRNTIFREPVIMPQVAERDLGQIFSGYALAGTVVHSLVENCAVLGGRVSPSDGYAAGLMGGGVNSVVLGCFNSADVFCNMANRYLPNTGGITGVHSFSYISRCANEGEVKGTHLTGGILGYTDSGYITRCVNSGYVWGSTIVGAVPAGGIIQANDGGITGYSYFVLGQSPLGAHSSDGLIAAVIPIEASELRQSARLPMLGSFIGDAPQWAYASLDAAGPVPYGIFKRRAAEPVINQAGNNIFIAPTEGVRYFHTTNGSDPYTDCLEPAEQLNITLKQGQILRVFAAKQGCRDSAVVTTEGGK